MKKSQSITIAAIVAAATLGDGVFALPYIFYTAGWLLSLIYIIVLGGMVVLAHTVYLETLEKTGEKQRLLGLSKKYLGSIGLGTGFLAVVVGLLLTLVAYLILGTQFIHLALPLVRERYVFAIFWALISAPIFLDDKRVVDLELLGIVSTTAIIIFIFINAFPHWAFTGAPAINWKYFFLPFGAVLFSLAGWTSVEPSYELRKKEKGTSGPNTKIPWKALAGGTLLAAALSILFSIGILGTAPSITPDTASGLVTWPLWERDLLSVMGLIAVATVYLPLSREIKNALEQDLKWNKVWSRGLIVLLPALLIALGFHNFLTVVGLVGGVFLSLQYLLIICVARKILPMSSVRTFFVDIVAAVFIIAAVYSLYTFVVH